MAYETYKSIFPTLNPDRDDEGYLYVPIRKPKPCLNPGLEDSSPYRKAIRESVEENMWLDLPQNPDIPMQINDFILANRYKDILHEIMEDDYGLRLSRDSMV